MFLLTYFLILAVVTKGLLDGIDRKLEDLGISAGRLKLDLSPVEECLELTMALTLLIVIWEFQRRSRLNRPSL